jgi:hypothetical protein
VGCGTPLYFDLHDRDVNLFVRDWNNLGFSLYKMLTGDDIMTVPAGAATNPKYLITHCASLATQMHGNIDRLPEHFSDARDRELIRALWVPLVRFLVSVDVAEADVVAVVTSALANSTLNLEPFASRIPIPCR